MSKSQYTTTSRLSHHTSASQLIPPGRYLDEFASTRSACAETTCPSRGPSVSSHNRSASVDGLHGWPLSGSVNRLTSITVSSGNVSNGKMSHQEVRVIMLKTAKDN